MAYDPYDVLDQDVLAIMAEEDDDETGDVGLDELEASGLAMTEDGEIVCSQCRRDPDFCPCNEGQIDPTEYVWDIDFGWDG